MLKKAIQLLLFLLFLGPLSFAYGDDTPMAVYDLKLFDYQLGMSYDEAISARAFHYTRYEERNITVGIVNGALIEDVEFNIATFMTNDSVFKIIGRFNPGYFKEVRKSLVKAYGKGVANSKSYQSPNGTKAFWHHYKWLFPGAEIHLIKHSSNSEFATLSMSSSEKFDGSTAEPPPQQAE